MSIKQEVELREMRQEVRELRRELSEVLALVSEYQSRIETLESSRGPGRPRKEANAESV